MSQKAIKEENIKKISDLLAAGTTKEEIIKDYERFGVSKATIKNYIKEIEMSKEKEVVEPVEEVKTPKLEMSARGKDVDVAKHNFPEPKGKDREFFWVACERLSYDKRTGKKTSESYIKPYDNVAIEYLRGEYTNGIDYVVLFDPTKQ